MFNSLLGFQRHVLTALQNIQNQLNGVLSRPEDLSITQVSNLEEFEDMEEKLRNVKEREQLVSKMMICISFYLIM